MGKLGNGTKLEPNTLPENREPGGRETARRPWGVLSGIVLGGGESPLQGEGPDGSTQPAKETRAGHVGLDKHEPTSLRGISNRAKASKDHRFQNLYQCLNAELLLECWQDLNKAAASGVDGVTAAQYRENLDENIQDLVRRLKTKCYRAKLVRRCYIPKDDGNERPLGIPALEDKLVQLGCAKLLNAIYEQDFLDFSNGYRPNRSAKETVADLIFNLQYGCYGYIVEADIKSFFDNIDHDRLLEMLAQRIDDRAFLDLIRQWLKAGILDTDGTILDPETGTPQGGVISPLLANVYLHHALDLWFENGVKQHMRGEAMMCRYADDFVCAFRFREDAESFYRVLPKRLGKFGLDVAPEKTQVLRFSRFHPSMKRRFSFLGFELYWFPDRQGEMRVKHRTSRKKLQGACRRIKEWIRGNRHLKGKQFIKELNRRLQGHYNYYGLRGNSESLYRFYTWAKECAFKWLNRRGGKRKSFTWKVFERALDRLGIALPKITEVKRQHVVYA
ncbi:MAG: group II intron reverse transcriptase/maturase [Gammaproteobacteria bacterium]